MRHDGQSAAFAFAFRERMDRLSSRGRVNVQRRFVRQAVESWLRDAIVTGRFPAGTHLSDRQLSESCAASRTIVREAVRTLEAEGLVVVRANYGPIVAGISRDEAIELYELRVTLEALAVEAFAVRANAEERTALRSAYQELTRLNPPDPIEMALRAKERFYAVLIDGCRNAHVSRTLRQLINRNAMLRATSLRLPGRLSTTVAELKLVVDAIDRHDAVAAGAACRAHVRSAADAALSVLPERE